jgi:hypothetical protein
VQETAHKTSFGCHRETHTHTCTHSQTCLAMMNAQPCLIGKTHTQACTSSFSAILECAGRPLRMHARANTHTRTHTFALGVLCHDTEKQRTEVCFLHQNTHECSISHSKCFSGTLKHRRCLSIPCDAHNAADETIFPSSCLSASWCFVYGLNVGNLHAMPSTHMPKHMPMTQMK